MNVLLHAHSHREVQREVPPPDIFKASDIKKTHIVYDSIDVPVN